VCPMDEPAKVDFEALTNLQTPWCLHVVATLRIAEHVAAGCTAIAELAAATGCDPDALACVLGHLASKGGVFAEPEPGRVALNDAARRLLEPSAAFLDLSGIGGRMAHSWGTLLTYVMTGRPAYHEIFGRPFWEDLAANPGVAASFDALMGPAGHGTPDPRFELAGGWDGVRTVVDVGGGTGAFLAELLRARPALAGTLVDLPGTVGRAGETFAAAGVADPGHPRRAELLRPAAGWRRPLPAEQGAERLAGRRDGRRRPPAGRAPQRRPVRRRVPARTGRLITAI
jgi:hypothetical protein